jgi:hypothetical protein
MSCASGTKDRHASERVPSTQAVGGGVELIATGVEAESTVTLQFHLKVFSDSVARCPVPAILIKDLGQHCSYPIWTTPLNLVAVNHVEEFSLA